MLRRLPSSTWQTIARALLISFGACSVAIVLSLLGSGRIVVLGAPYLNDNWFRVGLFAPGNEEGRVDRQTAVLLSELPSVDDTIWWVTQQLNYSSQSMPSVSGDFAFVPGSYLSRSGIQVEVGNSNISSDPELLLTSSGAASLGVKGEDIPVELRIGNRSFYVTGILGRDFVGPSPFENVLGLIHEHWLSSLVFPTMTSAEVEELPIYSIMLKPSAGSGSSVVSLLQSSGVASSSPLLATTTRTAWAAFRGPFRSPEEAETDRLLKAVLLSVAIVLFATACLCYWVTDGLSKSSFVRAMSIRRALGEVEFDQVKWLLTESLRGGALTIGQIFVLAVAAERLATSADSPVGGLMSWPPLWHLLAALAMSAALGLTPRLLVFGSNVILARVVSITSGVNGLQSRLLFESIAQKQLAVATLLLSAIVATCVVFYASITAFNTRPLGFGSTGLFVANIARNDTSPSSVDGAVAETVRMENMSTRLGIDLGATSCAPVDSRGMVTNVDTPLGGPSAALICYITPGALRALDLTILSGEIFDVHDYRSAVVSKDFLERVVGGGGVGGIVLREALGIDYRVSGVVSPVNLNATFSGGAPIAFLNGAGFGARGSLIYRGKTASVESEFSSEFGATVALAESIPVESRVSESNRRFLEQRALALLASTVSVILCAAALVACCLLVLQAWRHELGVRLAVGDDNAGISAWAIRRLARPILLGSCLGIALAPILAIGLDHVIPASRVIVLIALIVSAAFSALVVVMSVALAVRAFLRTASISELIRVGG